MPKRQEAETAPWEQQPDESAKAFAAFAAYRDMGEDRSIVKVGQKLGKNTTTLSNWSSKYRWVERARAYDKDLDRQAHTQAVRDVRRMTTRQINIAMRLQEKALDALQNLDSSKLTPQMLLNFITKATELERMNRLNAAGLGDDSQKDGVGEIEIIIEGDDDGDS